MNIRERQSARDLRWIWLAGVLCVGLFGPGEITRAQEAGEKLSLKYIPQTPVAAVVIHPQRMLKRPEFALMPLEVLQAAGLQELGLDPLQAKQMIAFGVFNPLITPPIDYGLIVRFAEPIDQQEMLKRWPLKLKKSTFQGLTLQVSQLEDRGRPGALPALPAFCVVEEKTLLLGTEWTLKMMLAAEGTEADSPLQKRLAEQTDSADMLVVVAMTPLRFLIDGVLGTMRDQIPPQLEPFQRIPSLIEAIELEVTLKQKVTLKLRHVCDDQDDARELEGLLQDAQRLGEAFLDSAVARLSESPRPEQAGTADYLQRIRKPVIEALMPKRQGRTLSTELEVRPSIAQLSALSGLMLPAVQTVRFQARQLQSRNNMKQIILAALNYESTHRQMPGDILDKKTGKPLLSWRVAILPYIGQQALYDQFELDEPWDSEHNKRVAERIPPIYLSPLSSLRPQEGKTSYLRPSGKGLAKDPQVNEIRIAAFRDGSSNTIWVVEANDEVAVPWSKPADLPVESKNPGKGLGQMIPGKFHAVFVDGSVMRLSSQVDGEVLYGLFTRSGGEVINPLDLND